jgi:aminoglycoside phosphotransferase (APT) family kinase protein
MHYVAGHIIKLERDTEPFSPDERRRQSESLVDVLAALHAVEPDDVGLGDLGKREDYVARQLRRWKRQVDEGSDRTLPLFDELHARLVQTIPAQQGAGIVHGDYRLDNCMIGPDNTVAAVLDWELCTLGDPLADLGGMLMWWGEPGRPSRSVPGVPTVAPGYLTRDEVVDRYAAASDRDLSDMPYYRAFQYWRLAAIMEGVRFRFAAGAMGDKDIGEESARYESQIESLLEDTRRALTDL